MFEREITYPAAYTSTAPGRDPEIEVALRWLIDRQRELGGTVAVFAPGRENVGRSAVLNHRRQTFTELTQRTFPRDAYRWGGGPVLALWPTSTMLEMVDDFPETKAVAAVPWALPELDTWIAARRPHDLLGHASIAPEPQIDDPVVGIAIRHLTNAVNLGTGLTHPSDKAHAVETFRMLKQAGHTWNPDQIRAWALRHGWTNDGAADLHRYATGILENRRFNTTSRYGLRPDIVEFWRREAESEPR